MEFDRTEQVERARAYFAAAREYEYALARYKEAGEAFQELLPLVSSDEFDPEAHESVLREAAGGDPWADEIVDNAMKVVDTYLESRKLKSQQPGLFDPKGSG